MCIDLLLERKLLVVPFNDDYYVDQNIKRLLTEEEFFEQCFLEPSFEEHILELKNLSSEEIPGFDIELTVSELIQKYDGFSEDLNNLYNWIDSNQNELYCIKGDAGTGKSTFLHYLNYKYKNSQIEWDIIDIKKAIKKVLFLGYSIDFEDFQSLYSKSISAILVNIKDKLFKLDKQNVTDYWYTKNIIQNIVKGYNSYFSDIHLDKRIVKFFNEVQQISRALGDKRKTNKLAELIKSYIENLFTVFKGNYPSMFAMIVEWYICIIVSLNSTKRHIIAFDNFERFIGTDEIYSFQLTHFVSELRNIQNYISDNYPVLSGDFQIIIFMRNTSTRMFLPQQVAEITAHSLDLSEWFNSSSIIEKKIKWYNNKNISINGAEIILEILHDIGGGDESVRGLRTKLNMIFNHNKRVIVKFLIKVISDPENQIYLAKYKSFWENTNQSNYTLSVSHSRFAARMIVFRLILNKLRDDEFFKNIVVQKTEENSYSLEFARKILTILYDYKLQNENPYMHFSDLIKRLFNSNNYLKRYFDKNSETTRIVVSTILFYMNYYNLRENNWLQFIDIQYNMPPQNIKVNSVQQLDSLIISDYRNINIRITNAGIAYLYFIVSSYEYFSCKALYSEDKKSIVGDIDLPPIMAIIPNDSSIMEEPIENQLSLKTIRAVYNEAEDCLKKLKVDSNMINFRYDIRSNAVSHIKRIVNMHTGFLGNYKHCVKEINKIDYNSSPEFAKKLDEYIKEINLIIQKYNQYNVD